ncbi:MAG: hypothetical protein EA402_01655, partial [Planctomycetota bacterium]
MMRPLRSLTWCRERLHLLWWPLAHVVLLLVVTINVYPFVWMLSTSVKTEAEAKLHQDRLIPERKWMLADDVTVTRKRLDQSGEVLPPSARR